MSDPATHRCPQCGDLYRLQADLQELREVPGHCLTCGITTFLKVGFHLPVWTVYQSPKDYPGRFVARLFVLDQPTLKIMVDDSLDGLRAKLPRGLTCLTRSDGDDPLIVETWL